MSVGWSHYPQRTEVSKYVLHVVVVVAAAVAAAAVYFLRGLTTEFHFSQGAQDTRLLNYENQTKRLPAESRLEACSSGQRQCWGEWAGDGQPIVEAMVKHGVRLWAGGGNAPRGHLLGDGMQSFATGDNQGEWPELETGKHANVHKRVR